MSLTILLALALAPGACIIFYIYVKDRYEKEPIRLLAMAFGLGIVSTFITLIISLPLDAWIPIEEHDLRAEAVHAFLLVALVEEFSKFIFLRWVFFRNPNFNEPFDGIVYSIMIGMGFATFENILYVMDGGFETAILRMFTAVPAHATFAVLMGYFVGRQKFEPDKPYLSFLGLIAAILFHGAYDYCWFVSYVPGIWLGAIVSLVIGVALSRKAISVQQEASPFRNPDPPSNAAT